MAPSNVPPAVRRGDRKCATCDGVATLYDVDRARLLCLDCAQSERRRSAESLIGGLDRQNKGFAALLARRVERDARPS